MMSSCCGFGCTSAHSISELVFEPSQVELEVGAVHQLATPARELGDDARRLHRNVHENHNRFTSQHVTSARTWLTMKGSCRLSMARKGDQTDCLVLRAYSLKISTRDLSSCKRTRTSYIQCFYFFFGDDVIRCMACRM